MSKHLISRLILMAFLFASYTNLTAQQSEIDTFNLQTTTVTATKSIRNLKEVPARISIVNSSEIENSAQQQISDILKYSAGVNVNRSSGIYNQRSMITLRSLSGDEQSRTLVLLDGIPLNTSDEGGVNWNRINPQDIDRIEIFKGPGSSLYGNNAMGGVINLISKKPEKPQEVFAQVKYGTFNTFRQDLGIRMRNENGYYASISQYYLKSDGYNSIPDSNRTPYDIERSLEEFGVSAKIGYDKSKWFNYEIQYDVFRDKRGEGYQIYVPGGAYRNFNTNLLKANLKGSNDKSKYTLSAFYQLEHYFDINERMRNGNYSRYDVNSFRKDMGTIFSLNHSFTKNNTLTTGFEFKKGSIEGGDYYQTAPYDTIYNAGEIITKAFYLQDEQAFFNEKMWLTAGFRFDNIKFTNGDFYTTDPWNESPELNENEWNELSPRVGMRFNFIKNISAYISYSHGFRASILDDLTRTGWMWVGPKYANPNLGPESLDNYEMGLDYSPSYKFRLATSAYLSKGNDFLYYVATKDSLYGRPIHIRENVTSVDIIGFEAEAKYHFNTRFSFMANYNFSKTKILAFDQRPELLDKELKFTPNHIASASIFWKNRFFNSNIKLLYKSQQFADDINSDIIDAYYTIDFRISKVFLDKFNASVEIIDLLDNQRMESNFYMTPGRIINLGLSLKM